MHSYIEPQKANQAHSAAGRAVQPPWKYFGLFPAGGSLIQAAIVMVFCLLAALPAGAAPIIGGQLFSTGGDVTVEVRPATAGFVSELHLYSPGPARFIALNTDVGTVVNLGSFPAGVELIFGIFVRNTGDTFRMGPGTRNTDGLAHAGVDVQGPGVAIVGFEDLLGGGDLDYDDNVFRFTGGIAPVGCPADYTIDAPSYPTCAFVAVNWQVTAPALTIVTCVPPNGSSFGIGVYPVICTATYPDSRTATCTFTLTVADREAPIIHCPANIVQGNDPGLCSATVAFAVSADDCQLRSVSCNPPSGSSFPKGTTPVLCTATDQANNSSTCTFTVTVQDREAPGITCPANIVQGNAPGQCSAAVTYAAAATDNCGEVTVACVPPSGTVFPQGTTPVTCTATDSVGLTASCSFTVTIEDREAPVVACAPGVNPAGKRIAGGRNATSSGFFQLLTSDNCDASPRLYVRDSASAFIAGPFHSGDTVKVTQAPGGTPSSVPMAGAVVAHIQLRGDALLYAVDAAGNPGVPVSCFVPPPPR